MRFKESPDRKHPISRRNLIAASTAGSLALGLHRQGGAEGTPSARPEGGATPVSASDEPDPNAPTSTFFSTVRVDWAATVFTESNGDLWPCAWADDDAIYTANGDGTGFEPNGLFADIVMNRVDGDPESGLTGERLSAAAMISDVWGPTNAFNRKPTGIIAVDGNGDGKDELYLAVQDLRHGPGAFDEAPNASISMSTDYGKTWTKSREPMFTNHRFTTIMFLDFGQSNAHASVLGDDGADYVYAYGIDFNWRDSFSDQVENPTNLYLARVPIDSIQDRTRWEFFAGLEGDIPTWDAEIENRQPVLTDTRRVYQDFRGTDISDMTVISQGGVVYNAPLQRYIYTSWTEYTWEFYEAPAPWGPWRLFLHKDFGCYPWFGASESASCDGPKNGGYGTVVPSKWISEDGRRMWVQSDWWVGVGCGDPTYKFALRPIDLVPFAPSTPENEPDPERNLALEPGTVAIEKTAHYGHTDRLNDGDLSASEDSWDNENKSLDWWGYTWPQEYTVNQVRYTSGEAFPDGGWFANDLRVQVRKDFRWTDVTGLQVSPDYPYDESANPFATYTFRFDPADCDGVRVIGTPGGPGCFTSIAELEVSYEP